MATMKLIMTSLLFLLISLTYTSSKTLPDKAKVGDLLPKAAFCDVDATCCLSNVCVPGEVVADREDCTWYYQCNQYGLWSNINCELEGTSFSCIAGMCQFEGGEECFDVSLCTTCPEDPPYYPGGTCNPGNCEEFEDGLTFPDSNDCHLFHICVQGFMITTPCNIGDAFDIYDLTCKPEITVDCSIRCLAPITSTAPPADTSTDYPYPDHCHEMTVCCRPTPCMQWYKVADSTNCSNYYECVDNMWFHFECYLDHLFDCERGCTDVIPACFPGGCDTPCE